MYGQTYSEWVTRVLALRDQLRATTGEARLTVVTSLVNAVGNAAVNAPDATLRTRWLEQYRALRPVAANLRATYTPNPPPAWLRALDVFSDHALAVADDVGKGVGATARALPLIVPIIAIGIGAIYLLPMLKRRGSRG